MRILSLCAVVLFVSSACKKKGPCSNRPYERLFEFRLVDKNNNDLLDSTNALYAGKIYTINTCTHEEIGTTIYADSARFFCKSPHVSYEGVLTDVTCSKMLLKYENGDIDTVTYDIVGNEVSDCTIVTMKNVKFNGAVAELAVADYQTYFTFRK